MAHNLLNAHLLARCSFLLTTTAAKLSRDAHLAIDSHSLQLIVYFFFVFCVLLDLLI